MPNLEEELNNRLLAEEEKLAKECEIEDAQVLLLSILRNIDSVFSWLPHSDPEGQILGMVRLGWQGLIAQVLPRIPLDRGVVNFVSPIDWEESVWGLVFKSAKITQARRLEEFARRGLGTFSKIDNAFVLKLETWGDLERIDRESFEFVAKVMRMQAEDTSKKGDFKPVFKAMKKMVMNPYGKYISYSSNEVIDSYYEHLASDYVLSSSLHQEFGDTDTFNGVPFSQFKRIMKLIYLASFRHIDFCKALCEQNPEVNFTSVVTHSYDKSKIIKSIAGGEELSIAETEYLLSFFTLNIENIDAYNLVSEAPPPYFEFGRDQLTRSAYGGLGGALDFCLKELKRRCQADYFKAVNNRESRFRDDLYSLFVDTRYLKVNRSVLFRKKDFTTDIDAVIFDANSRTLGIFQLKWQDYYGYSLSERESRHKNLSAKTVEWVDKLSGYVDYLFQSNSQSSLLSDFQLLDADNTVETVCLFVLGRNSMNFTNDKHITEKAAYGTWYQVFNATAMTRFLGDDRILELFMALKMSRNEYLGRSKEDRAQTLDIHFSDFKVQLAS